MPVHGSSLSVADLCTKLSEALAENERLRKDAERLDYLDDPARTWTFWMGRMLPDGASVTWPVFKGESIRAAIDAALARSDRGRG